MLILCGIYTCTESVTLYPYGEDDSTLGRSDEGTSGFQWLPKPISFYGKNYDKLVVSMCSYKKHNNNNAHT